MLFSFHGRSCKPHTIPLLDGQELDPSLCQAVIVIALEQEEEISSSPIERW